MFSALRRLTSTKGDAGSANNAGGPPPGLHAMSSSLQKKFAKGVQYNMKIVIKGDRNCGKTCLFRRLQGLSFLEEYIPTDEIQVANINWNYKTNDDVVKVEIWDIVDKAKRKRGMQSKLKIENQNDDSEDVGPEEMALDASFVDVYKNCNGVIFVFDVTKNWTFDYVRRELPKVPSSLPIIILSNHRDSESDSRVVANDTVQFFIEGLGRDSSAGEILFTESSMRNGFGLKFVHKFFNLPFLQLQRDTLMKQLESNQSESLVTLSELNLYAESDEANYDFFLECLAQKSRPASAVTKPPEPADINPKKMTTSNSSPRIDNRDQVRQSFQSENSSGANVSDSISNESIPVGNMENVTLPTSAISGNKSESVLKPTQTQSQPVRPVASTSDILDFVPEFENPPDKYFLDDKPEKNSIHSEEVHDSSDDDDKNWNPMVMTVVEDVQPSSYAKSPKINRSDNNELLSSTEDLDFLGQGVNSKASPSAYQPDKEVGKEKSKVSTKIGLDPMMPEILSSAAAGSTHGSAKREKTKNKKRHRRKSKPEEDYNAFIAGTGEVTQTSNLDSSAYELLE